MDCRPVVQSNSKYRKAERDDLTTTEMSELKLRAELFCFVELLEAPVLASMTR